MKERRLHGKRFRTYLEDHLDFKRWEFRCSHFSTHDAYSTRCIYTNPFCKIKIMLSNTGHFPDEDEISFWYGRHHAPDKDLSMLYKGEDCWAWHQSILYVVQFLEGIPVQDLISHKVNTRKILLPTAFEDFFASETMQQIRKTYYPEAIVRREAFFWQLYGERMFQLFDLRNEDMWNEYREYLRSYLEDQRIKERRANTWPPDWYIC